MSLFGWIFHLHIEKQSPYACWSLTQSISVLCLNGQTHDILWCPGSVVLAPVTWCLPGLYKIVPLIQHEIWENLLLGLKKDVRPSFRNVRIDFTFSGLDHPRNVDIPNSETWTMHLQGLPERPKRGQVYQGPTGWVQNDFNNEFNNVKQSIMFSNKLCSCNVQWNKMWFHHVQPFKLQFVGVTKEQLGQHAKNSTTEPSAISLCSSCSPASFQSPVNLSVKCLLQSIFSLELLFHLLMQNRFFSNQKVSVYGTHHFDLYQNRFCDLKTTS